MDRYASCSSAKSHFLIHKSIEQVELYVNQKHQAVKNLLLLAPISKQILQVIRLNLKGNNELQQEYSNCNIVNNAVFSESDYRLKVRQGAALVCAVEIL